MNIREIVCGYCKKTFYASRYNATYCKRTCKENARHTRQVGYARSRYTHIRQTVYEMHNGICAICTNTIDLTIKHPDPYSYSVDHIVPKSKGGSDGWDNLQATHLVCNVYKADR